MPDPRSVMQEFRTLDAKRLAKGLSPEEERRLAELRDLVGGEAGAGAPRGGFDVNAAAARLRESLLPAGLRNRPPPPPELSPEPEPEPFFPASPPAPALEAPAPATDLLAGEDPSSALFDPATLGWEGDGASVPGPLDPAAEAAAWGPDATAADQSALSWDPSAAALDPSAQPWDPSAAALDPSAQPWDPSAAALDPSAQAWDPNAAALDPSAQPWDPAAAALDPSAQAWDPSAAALDPSAQPWDPAASQLDAGAQPASRGGWDAAYDASSAVGPEASAPEAELGVAWADGPAPEGQAGSLDAALAPVELDASGSSGDPVELTSLGGEEDGAWEAAPLAESGPLLDAGWDAALAPEPEPTQAFALGAGSPAPAAEDLPTFDLEAAGFELLATEELLDADAAPEPTQLLGLASDPEPTQALSLGGDAAGLPPADWDPAPPPSHLEAGVPFGAYDEDPGAGAGALSPDDGPAPRGGLAVDDQAPAADPAELELGEYDDTAAFAPGAASEPDFTLASGGSFDAPTDPTGAWATGEAPAPWELSPAAGASPLAMDVDVGGDGGSGVEPITETHPLGPEAAPLEAAGPPDELSLPEIVEELPTVDGEEILEEIPADEVAFPPAALEFAPPVARSVAAVPPAVAAPPAAAPLAGPAVPASAAPTAPRAEASAPPATLAAGAHRVVVHTVEGTVKRGVIEDADLAAPSLVLVPGPDTAAEPIATDKVKAIFFMLAPGEAPPAAEGKRVRVTFRDGRQVAGYSEDYREEGPGFFMVPGDTRTNTGRIWVYRAAAREVSVS